MSFSKSEKIIKEEELYKVNKKEYLLSCASCNKKLIKIHSTPDIKYTQKLKCKCPCGDYSFVQTVEGKYFLESLSADLPIRDVDMEAGIIYVGQTN